MSRSRPAARGRDVRGQRARLFHAVLAGHAERDRRARDDAAAGDVRRDGARVLVRQCHHCMRASTTRSPSASAAAHTAPTASLAPPPRPLPVNSM
jgi:hypothetical protein